MFFNDCVIITLINKLFIKKFTTFKNKNQILIFQKYLKCFIACVIALNLIIKLVSLKIS